MINPITRYSILESAGWNQHLSLIYNKKYTSAHFYNSGFKLKCSPLRFDTFDKIMIFYGIFEYRLSQSHLQSNCTKHASTSGILFVFDLPRLAPGAKSHNLFAHFGARRHGAQPSTFSCFATMGFSRCPELRHCVVFERHALVPTYARI